MNKKYEWKTWEDLAVYMAAIVVLIMLAIWG